MATFSYFPNLPNGPDYPGDDQPGMQTNTQSTGSLLAIDHVGFNVVGGGQHNQITFNNNQSAPSLSSGVAGLYVNLVNSLSTLFFQNSTQNLQLTNLSISGSSPSFGVTTPWGLILNFGAVACNPNATITFAVPMTNAQYALVLGGTANQTVWHTGFNGSGATAHVGGGSSAVYYIAIGR